MLYTTMHSIICYIMSRPTHDCMISDKHDDSEKKHLTTASIPGYKHNDCEHRPIFDNVV